MESRAKMRIKTERQKIKHEIVKTTESKNGRKTAQSRITQKEQAKGCGNKGTKEQRKKLSRSLKKRKERERTKE